MSVALLERMPARPEVEPGVPGLVAEVASRLQEASRAPVGALDDEALGGVIGQLAVVESRAAALRLALSAEADRRRVAEATAETGTDAWVARLTGTTREQAAGG